MNFSSKTNLQVEIFDQLGRGSLREHAEGGVKVPKGAQLAVPFSQKYQAWFARRAEIAETAKSDECVQEKRSDLSDNRARSKSRRIKVMYFLKKSVPIPKQVLFYKDFADTMTSELARELPGAVFKAMSTRR